MRRLLSALAISMFALVACDGYLDRSTSPDIVVGAYTLVTLGGHALPTALTANGGTVTSVTMGTLELTTDGHWTETLAIQSTTAGGPATSSSLVSEGSWSIRRDVGLMTFYDRTSGYQFTGVAAGRQITLESVSGTQYIYRR